MPQNGLCRNPRIRIRNAQKKPVVYLRSENQRVVLIDGGCLDLAEHLDYIDRRDPEIADSFVLRRPDFGDIEGLNAAPRRSRPNRPAASIGQR
jgi:hypothetical protein